MCPYNQQCNKQSYMDQLQSHYCQQCTHIIANWILEIDYHIINFFMMDFLNMILHICQLQFSHTFYCNQCGHFFFFFINKCAQSIWKHYDIVTQLIQIQFIHTVFNRSKYWTRLYLTCALVSKCHWIFYLTIFGEQNGN